MFDVGWLGNTTYVEDIDIDIDIDTRFLEKMEDMFPIYLLTFYP